jgi:hypothetical protein
MTRSDDYTRPDLTRPDDVPEADLAEQQTPVVDDVDADEQPDLSPLAPTSVTDGNPADLIEQSQSAGIPDVDDEDWQR